MHFALRRRAACTVALGSARVGRYNEALTMRYPRACLCPFVVLCLLGAGCARMPSDGDGPDVPTRQLIVQFVLSGPADPLYYYFIAVDANGDPDDGPVPIVANPSAPVPATGVPLIISDSDLPPEFYVQHHQEAFFQYRNLDYIGPPYQGGVSEDGRTIAVILDLDDISASAEHIELNIITADRLLPPESQFIELNYDGLGPSGNSYVIIPVEVSGVYDNDGAIIPEGEGDAAFAALDIVDWSVEVRLTQ